MTNWILPGLIIALSVLTVSAFFMTGVFAHAGDFDSDDSNSEGSCGSPGCDGSCTPGSNCGNPTCGAVNGGSCGCGR